MITPSETRTNRPASHVATSHYLDSRGDFLEDNPDMVFRITQDGVILEYFAGTGTRPFRPPEELLGHSLAEIMPVETANFLLPRIQETIESQKIQYCYISIPDGEELVDYQARLVPGKTGEIYAIVRNLTEEETARQGQALLQVILSHIPAAIILTDSHGIVKRWCGSAEAIFGYRENEATGKPFASVLKLTENPFALLSRRDWTQNGCRASETTAHGKDGQPIEIHLEAVEVTGLSGGHDGYVLTCSNLTSQRQAEAMAAKGRKQQEAILNNIPDIAWLKDTESRFVLVNAPFAEACGLSQAEVVGKTDLELWPREIAEKYRQDDREIMANGETRRIEEPIVFVDGSQLIIETIKTPVHDIDGKVIGTTGIARDITAKARAEKALRESENRYRTLFDSSAVAFLLIRQYQIADCSEQSCKLFGLTREQIIGLTIADISPIDQPDGKSSHEAIMVRLDAGHEGTQQRFNWRFRGGDGEPLETEMCLKRIQVDSEFAVVAEIRDVTQRLKSERRVQEHLRFLQQLIDSIPTPVFYKDTAGVFVGCNRTFESSIGMSRSEIVGRTAAGIFNESEATLIVRQDERVLTSGRTESWEGKLTFADGTVRDVVLCQAAYRNTDAKLGGLVGTILDISDRKKAEETLRDSEERYRSLVENTAEGIAIVDLEDRCLFANRSAEVIFGVAAGTFVGRKVPDFTTPEQYEKVRQIVAKRGPGETSRYQLEIIGSDGKQRTLFVSSAHRYDAQGQRCGSFAIFRDVTERQKFEQKLRESEEKLREAQRIGRIGHWELEVETGALTFSDQMYEIFELDRSIEELNSVELWRKYYGEELDKITDAVESATKGLTPINLDCSIVLPSSGSRKFVQLQGGPIVDKDGRLIRIVGTLQDITDRKRIEMALRESEERFRLAISSSGMIVSHQNRELEYEWIFNPDPDTELEDLNVEAHEPLFWPDEVDRVVKMKKRVLNTGIGERTEYRAFVQNSRRYYDLNIEPRRDMHGAIIGITNVAIDITARKHAERSLSESHRLLTALMTNLPGMIYRCRNDVDRTLEFASDGCYDLTGFPVEDLIGSKKLTFGGLIHPDDRESTNRQLQAALDAGEQYELTYRILGADGKERWVWEHGWAEGDFAQGKVSLQGLILDVTEQRTEDERRIKLTAAVEQAAEAIMITDTEGRIQYVNPAFEEIMGFSQTEVIGKNPRLMKSGEHSESFYKSLWDTILRGEVWKGRLINKRKDGTLVEAESSIRAVRDAGGKIINFVAVKRDVTKLVALETQLRQAQKLEAVGALAAGIAHEINTPIQFVGDNTHFLSDAFADLLKLMDQADELAKTRAELANSIPEISQLFQSISKTDLPYLKEEIPRALEQSLQGIDRVANIVRAMKDFSHPDKREMSMIDINRALSTTLTVAHNELKYVANVVKELDPDLPSVLGYASELNQVFLNLLVNAAHAIGEVTSEGKERGTITVRTSHTKEAVVVSISDTGIGIKLAVRDRVFEPFFTTKEVGRGTGQGLAIARATVVEKHGGEIYFETEEGKGTTFFVKLPLRTTQESLV